MLNADMNEDLAGMRDELIRGEHAAEAFALHKQQRIAEANARIDHAFVDGLGELKMQIHSDIYWRMVALYGPRCWHDPEFRKSVYAKNPEVRVHCRSRKTAVHVDGMRGGAGNGRTRTSTDGQGQGGRLILASR